MALSGSEGSGCVIGQGEGGGVSSGIDSLGNDPNNAFCVGLR